MEITVKTKEDFERALKNKPQKIVLEGSIAEEIQKSFKMKNTAKVVGIGGGALAIAGIIGGIVSAPFTMGASLGATAAGVAGLTGAAGLTAALTIGDDV